MKSRLGVISLKRSREGVLRYDIDDTNATMFAVKMFGALHRKKVPSMWTRLRSVSSILNSDNHVKESKGGVRCSYFSKEILFEYLLWAIDEVSDADCVDGIAKELGYKDRVRVIHSRAEFEFGEGIVKNLFKDYEVIEQFPVFGGRYFIDWYIPELNIAIEYDEYHHVFIREDDCRRQKEIEEELGCKFLRYSERQ